MLAAACRSGRLGIFTPGGEPSQNIFRGCIHAGFPAFPPRSECVIAKTGEFFFALDILANGFAHHPLLGALLVLRQALYALFHVRVDLHGYRNVGGAHGVYEYYKRQVAARTMGSVLTPSSPTAIRQAPCRVQSRSASWVTVPPEPGDCIDAIWNRTA